MPWSPDVPFDDLPALPPAGLDLEPKPVLKAAIEARTALATLSQAAQLLPNPNILIQAVPLLEAQASSEIENIMTTADELFKHVESGGGDHATKEALRLAEGAWIEWILYMLDVVHQSATSTTRKIGAIRACEEGIAERARAATPGGRDAQFLAVLFEQPYCRIGTVASRCDVSRQTASSWLHALVGVGILRDVKVGREVLFVNHEFLGVLTRAE